MKSINCKGTLIDLSTPKVMGILNITPDSFYDGGKHKNDLEIINHVKMMITEGATFIDVGAYSSRPGAQHISEKEEAERIIPIVKLLVQEIPHIQISIDTFRSAIAKSCIKAGASMINDISGGEMDSKMFEIIAEVQVPYVMMHMQGTPQNMQLNPTYTNVVQDIIYKFSEKIYKLHALGVNDIISDVGFGFGKTIEQNYELLNHLALFQNLDVPILVGLSRKSMLYKPFQSSAPNALNATTSANTIALLNGANILRVHDVKEAVESIKIVELTKNQQ